MERKVKPLLLNAFLVIGSVFLLFYGLSMAKSVLAPIFLAILLAMVLSPVANFLQKHGFNRGWAAFTSDLIFVIFVCVVVVAVGAEVKKVASNASTIQDRISQMYTQVDSFFEKKIGYNLENPFQGTQSQKPEPLSDNANRSRSSGSSAEQTGDSTFGSVQGFLKKALTWTFHSITTFLLICVYIFFMLLFRNKFEKAVLYFVPERHRGRGETVIAEILKDAQQYLFGHVILILVLTGFYTLGFLIAGMKGAFTTALLASVLTLVPYVGTMIGNILAVGIAFITTGSLNAVWIVVGTVTIGQFFESYFLEPYVVGDRMNINPLFTILSVTVGAAVWGVIGMVVFLPLFSFIKAIADNVSMLHPVGYFLGKEDTKE